MFGAAASADNNVFVTATNDSDADAPNRIPRWLYILPIAGAPLAHIFVSSMKKYPAFKRPLAVAVVLSTISMVGNRLYLMGDAGYPGAEGAKDGPRFLS